MGAFPERRWLGAPLLAGLVVSGCASGNPERDLPKLGVEPGARYAVMAVVPREGRVHWGLGQAAAEQEATAEALQLCGASRCRVVHTYGPGDCVAVVLGRDQVFWTENNQETAQSAMDYCAARTSDCRVVRQLCL